MVVSSGGGGERLPKRGTRTCRADRGKRSPFQGYDWVSALPLRHGYQGSTFVSIPFRATTGFPLKSAAWTAVAIGTCFNPFQGSDWVSAFVPDRKEIWYLVFQSLSGFGLRFHGGQVPSKVLFVTEFQSLSGFGLRFHR